MSLRVVYLQLACTLQGTRWKQSKLWCRYSCVYVRRSSGCEQRLPSHPFIDIYFFTYFVSKFHVRRRNWRLWRWLFSFAMTSLLPWIEVETCVASLDKEFATNSSVTSDRIYPSRSSTFSSGSSVQGKAARNNKQEQISSKLRPPCLFFTLNMNGFSKNEQRNFI